MFWDWKQLTLTYDFTQQSCIRSTLSNGAIDYKIKTVNRTSPSPIAPSRRSYTGTIGETASMYEYIFYVRQKDYDLAVHLLHSHGDSATGQPR